MDIRRIITNRALNKNFYLCKPFNNLMALGLLEWLFLLCPIISLG
jgi:hypothetical protein